LQTLQDYIFEALQHFATKFCNFTNVIMFFLAVVFPFSLLRLKCSLTCKLSIVWRSYHIRDVRHEKFAIGICKSKNAQVVTNLQQTCSNAVPTTCQQDVFALLVPSSLTSYYKVVELNRLVTSCSNLSSCNSTICQQVVRDNLVAT
jgi:hypothetical protein